MRIKETNSRANRQRNLSAEANIAKFSAGVLLLARYSPSLDKAAENKMKSATIAGESHSGKQREESARVPRCIANSAGIR